MYCVLWERLPDKSRASLRVKKFNQLISCESLFPWHFSLSYSLPKWELCVEDGQHTMLFTMINRQITTLFTVHVFWKTCVTKPPLCHVTTIFLSITPIISFSPFSVPLLLFSVASTWTLTMHQNWCCAEAVIFFNYHGSPSVRSLDSSCH